ncbi:protein ZBED8-like, partial [Limulus polyphemus]|uniref:Protein ZBED8-like n=1 Tax=Limulus polyphemus TaxID=6850 RepID=A0ABM1C4D0_LIMPO
MDSEHTVLLYHTEVRWLSHGHVLQRIFELCEEIKTFLKDQKLDLFSSFDTPEIVQMLAYLTDIFTHSNELNISLQGSNKNVVIAHEKLAFFKAKIPLWLRNIEKGNLARFPLLEEVVEEHESLLPEVATAICIHLEQLLNAFDGYFSAGNLARFPSLEEVVEVHESLLPEVATAIRIHFEQLLNAFDG